MHLSVDNIMAGSSVGVFGGPAPPGLWIAWLSRGSMGEQEYKAVEDVSDFRRILFWVSASASEHVLVEGKFGLIWVNIFWTLAGVLIFVRSRSIQCSVFRGESGETWEGRD